MEGTITTPEELLLFEAGQPSDGPSKREDTEEVGNYIAAMTFGLGRITTLPICLRLIREVHEKLLAGVRGQQERPGEFRRSQNWIANRPGDDLRDARYVAPPVVEMNECLAEFEKYLNIPAETLDAAPFLVRVAAIHYQFEAIHPFRDGNGRIGRLLIPLMLRANGRLPAPLLYVSSFFERHREKYSDLLLRVSQSGDWASWIEFFLEAVFESGNESLDQADGLLKLRAQYRTKLSQSKRTSALLLGLVDRLFESPLVTITGVASALSVTKTSASNNIKRLVDEGILQEMTGRARGQMFVAPEIAAFLRDKPGPV